MFPVSSPPRRSCSASRLRRRDFLAEMAPLAADPTSGGAAARLDMASMQLWGAACAQAYSLHKAAGHLIMIAQKFGTPGRAQRGRPECDAASGGGAWTTPRWPPWSPFRRSRPTSGYPCRPGAAQRRGLLPAGPPRLAGAGCGSAPPRRTTGPRSTPRRPRVREVAATGAGPVGKPRRHRRARGPAQRTRHRAQHDRRPVVRTREPGAQARRRLQPDGRRDAEAAGVQGRTRTRFDRAQAAGTASPHRSCCGSAASSNSARSPKPRGTPAVTETSTSPRAWAHRRRPGAGGARRGRPAVRAQRPAKAAAAPEQAQLAKAGAAEAGQAGQAGEGPVSWRRCCPPRSARSGVWRAVWQAWPVRSRRHSCRPAKAWRRPPRRECPGWRRRTPPTPSCPSRSAA